MITSIRSNFTANIKQNSQNTRNTPTQIQPQLRGDSVSFGRNEILSPKAISLLSEHAAEWWAIEAKRLTNGTQPAEKIERFKTALQESIAKVISELRERVRTFGLSISVDEEHTNPLLIEALAKAGIENKAIFPKETTMLIHPLQIQTGNGTSGYAQTYQLPKELWP